MSVKIKQLRVDRAKAVAEARAIMDDETKPIAERQVGFDAAMKKADDLKKEIDALERLDDMEKELGNRTDISARLRGISKEQQEAENAAQNDAFGTYIRYGMSALNEEQRKIAAPRMVQPQAAQSTGSQTAGGYMVAPGFWATMESAQKAFGGMVDPNIVFLFDTDMGNELPIPTDNDTSNEGALVGENPPAVPEQDVTLGQVMLNAYTYTSKLVRVSNQLLQDSAYPLESWLAEKLGTRVARRVNRDLTTGDAASKPQGVTVGSVAGKVGATGQTLSIIFDDLIDLEHSVDPAYRNGARFMMADDSLKIVKKLKDGEGRYIWLPGTAIKEPDTILGYQFTVNQHMAVMAANAKSVLFGAFKKYYVRRVTNPLVMRLAERFADQNQVAFVMFQRWDGKLIDAGTNPVKHYANSAT